MPFEPAIDSTNSQMVDHELAGLGVRPKVNGAVKGVPTQRVTHEITVGT